MAYGFSGRKKMDVRRCDLDGAVLRFRRLALNDGPAELHQVRSDSKNGGLIRGPGTGISDSIPRDMRKGSFIMPADSTAFFGARELAGLSRQAAGLGNHADYQLTPEQVYTIGWNVLDAMRRSTHTPVVLQTLLARHRDGRPGFDDGTNQNPTQSSGQSGGSTVPTAGGNPGLGANTLNVGTPTPQGAYTAPLKNNALPGSGNDVVRNGNSYWGTNVSGGVTINGQQPANGTFNSVPGGSGAAPVGQPNYAAAPTIAMPTGNSGGTISNPATSSAASQALAGASRAYAGSPNGQLTANQLRTMQGLATNESQERNAQLSNATAQNNAAMQAATQMAQINTGNQQFQQKFAAEAPMRDYQNAYASAQQSSLGNYTSATDQSGRDAALKQWQALQGRAPS